MVSVEFSEGISETLDILNHMEKSYTDKIPKKFKEFLENNKSKNYIPNLDHSQKINEMHLKEKTKDILATIYMNYWCDSQEKSHYIKLLNDNERKSQETLREKYDPDNIFKKKHQEINFEGKKLANETTIVKYKESFFRKFINKIKNIFSR